MNIYFYDKKNTDRVIAETDLKAIDLESQYDQFVFTKAILFDAGFNVIDGMTIGDNSFVFIIKTDVGCRLYSCNIYADNCATRFATFGFAVSIEQNNQAVCLEYMADQLDRNLRKSAKIISVDEAIRLNASKEFKHSLSMGNKFNIFKQKRAIYFSGSDLLRVWRRDSGKYITFTKNGKTAYFAM